MNYKLLLDIYLFVIIVSGPFQKEVFGENKNVLPFQRRMLVAVRMIDAMMAIAHLEKREKGVLIF